jgi:hypothetical protein
MQNKKNIKTNALAKEENAKYMTAIEKLIHDLRELEALNLPRYSDNEAFKYLNDVTDVASLSPEERARYERDLTNYWDACALDRRHDEIIKEAKKVIKEYNEARYGLKEAKRKEEEEGKAEEKLSIARGLIKMNMPPTDIAKVTGLSIDEINGIDLN